MERVSRLLGWKKRSDLEKTLILIVIVVGGTLGAFGLFTIAMGTSSPLVVVTSGSMSPTLERGHLLVIQRQAPEDIILGEIIVFNASWHQQAPVVHRVVEVEVVGNETRWYTRGDANSIDDQGYRTYDDILGVVVLVIPYVGYITLYLHTPVGFASVVILLLMFLILPEFLVRGDKEDKAEVVNPPDSETEPSDYASQKARQQDL